MRRLWILGAAFLALSLGGAVEQTVGPHVQSPVHAVAPPSPMPTSTPIPTATPDPASPSPTPNAAPPNPAPAPASASFACAVVENGQLVLATCTGSHTP